METILITIAILYLIIALVIGLIKWMDGGNIGDALEAIFWIVMIFMDND